MWTKRNISLIVTVLTLVLVTVLRYIKIDVITNSYSTIVITIFSICIIYLSRDLIRLEEKVDSVKKTIANQEVALYAHLKLPQRNMQRVSFADNIDKSEYWKRCEKFIDIFNAPWSLAEEVIIEGIENMLRKDVVFRVIVFEGNSNNDKIKFETRIKRITKCFSEISSKSKVLRKKIFKNVKIKKVCFEKMPTTTFFNTFLNNYGNTSILYIFPLMEGDRPQFSIQVNDQSVNDALRTQFDKYWSVGEIIPVNSILK